MENRILKIIVVFSVFYLLFGSCSKSENKFGSKTDRVSTTAKFKFGLVTGPDGLGDNAFNDMHYNAMIESRRLYNIEFEYMLPENDQAFDKAVEELISKECNVIIAGAGFMMIDTVETLSLKYPDIYFILDDAEAKTHRDNVTSVVYKQNEGSYLAGALAAMVSETDNIAVFGGGDFPVINDFIVGYEAGGKYIKNDINIFVKYYPDYIKPDDAIQSGWSRPDLGLSLSKDLIMNENVDVIFHVAGSSGTGGFQAAKEHGIYAIGVDSDQDYLVEGSILTSMMKNVDKTMVNLIGEFLDGKLENRNYAMGLDKNGIGLSPMTYTRDKISTEYLERIDKIKTDIISGKIVVPTAF